MSIHTLSLRRNGSDPERLDDFLRFALPPELTALGLDPSLSNSKIRRLILAGAVTVDSQRQRNPAWSLAKGERIVVRLDTDRISFEKTPDDIPFELTDDRVLFEDDWIIVVDKPAGFPTEATVVASRDHLQAAVARYLARKASPAIPADAVPYVGLHHRLDRETSGVILFTKDKRANPGAHKMFLERLAQKEYEALTLRPARLPPVEFSVINELGRITPKSAQGKWGAVKTGGEPAHTDFSVLEIYHGFLRVKALPHTGRTHQIRVHLAGVGLPLLGDSLYGGPDRLSGYGTADESGIPDSGNAASAYLKKKAAQPASGITIPRVMLHAAALTFPHPVDGRLISVTAPLPADFSSILNNGGTPQSPRQIRTVS